MTDEEVLAAVLEHAGPDVAATFSMRLEAQGPHPGDKVFPLAVPCPGDCYLVITFSFGRPDPDAQRHWAPAWHAVDGPMTRQQVTDYARRLKEGQEEPPGGA